MSQRCNQCNGAVSAPKSDGDRTTCRCGVCQITLDGKTFRIRGSLTISSPSIMSGLRMIFEGAIQPPESPRERV